MSTPATNIRVFVRWSEPTVFAGEDVECHITFKNIAPDPNDTKSSSAVNGSILGAERLRKALPTQGTAAQPKNTQPQVPQHNISHKRGHRPTLSLSGPPEYNRSPYGSGNCSVGHGRSRAGGSHARSVSIISIGASEKSAAGDEPPASAGLGNSLRRPSKGHRRAASLQIMPRSMANGSSSAQASPFPRTTPHRASHSVNLPDAPSPRPGRNGGSFGTAPNTPSMASVMSPRRNKGSSPFQHNFVFPAGESATDRSISDLKSSDKLSPPKSQLDAINTLSPRQRDGIPTISEHVAPFTRVLSPSSNSGTPRSSGEFYSLSNNSNETLASEHIALQSGRNLSGHMRKPSNLGPNATRGPETLMMGYAQIQGSFTLDGSLVSQTPFEEVKKKAIVGGHGGGLVGVETTKRDSGLLRGFGWGSLGESIGGLLAGTELSTIKDMRDVSRSKTIPLLSTPQSILFVDLRLAPGESKSYRYSFKLPRGLPPSHKGKAMKIAYNIVIGTQRSGGAKEQQVKSVEIPFRVLGSVNNYGELLGHDLMSPYIILRDEARVQTNGSPNQSASLSPKIVSRQPGMEDFLAYVDELISRPRENSSFGLLSPTESPGSRRPSVLEKPVSAKEAIDLAILRSNMTGRSQRSANRFEIARSGRRVAVIMLARPAYRLGETITAAIDFTDSSIPCYAVHASLETCEKVDSSIALRSESSIQRVTRKIYASLSESTLFARRTLFQPSIPPSATPDFLTSGISLEWKLRIEFVTPRIWSSDDIPAQQTPSLLEEVARDERGSILAATQAIDCESFDITLPLRVYGALAGQYDHDKGLGGLVI